MAHTSEPRGTGGVAGVLSFLWPGLGHIYLGYPVLGIIVATLTGVATIVAYQILTSWRVQLFGASGMGDQEKVIVGAVLVGGTVVWLAAILHSLHLAKRTDTSRPGAAKASITPLDIGEETWQAISRSDNRALFSEFIQRFPDHPRVLLARLRISESDQEVGGTREVERQAELHEAPAPLSRFGDAGKKPPEAAVTVSNNPNGAAFAIVSVILIAAVVLGVWQHNEFQERQRAAAEQQRVERKRIEDEREKEEQAKADRERESARSQILATIANSTDMAYLKALWDDPDEWVKASAVQRWKDLNAKLRPRMQMTLDADRRVMRADNNEMLTVRWGATYADSCVVFGPNGFRDNRMSGAISGSSDKPALLRFTFRCFQKDAADGKNERDLVVEIRAE